MVVSYAETVVWDDPLVVLIEEHLLLDGEIESSTFTVYSGGDRLVTAISEEAAWTAVQDIIATYVEAEEEGMYA